LDPDFKVIEIEMERDARKLFDENPSAWARERSELIAIQADHDVVYSMHGPYLGSDADLSSRDETVRLASVDYMSRFIDEAQQLRMPYLTVHPGFLDSDREGAEDFSFEQLMKSITTLGRNATCAGVQLLLENTGPDRPSYIVLSDDQHEQLCDEAGVGLTLDIVHFQAFYADMPVAAYWEKLERILPYVKNAHFNDVRGTAHQHLPLGTGDFQFQVFLERMESLGYRGNYIVEERGGGYEPAAYVEATKRYVDSLTV
jgi:sugar phosphate isomerase/epimerase